ncbi:hypothetical protein ACFQZ4_03855 [Catellatospora coxensis]|uniref:Uncharacterized protein n=1 Tax=Catellatospora coxensis TaxID=310354 RepID=A0A8J3P964_9ACTN|nr:hypothetical protein [Catellatospora coxensis]GIG06431.1 hypothetical protein Cco03nite_31310 [Catellatospora coxensis]
MSMHDIEDLVSASVVVLDARHAEDDGRLRDWFTALYAFQAGFDCSHTQGRVLDILLRRGHTYRLALHEHPDYEQRREFFDGLTEFQTLREVDEEDDDFAGYDDWLEDGYVDPPWLYCEAGTALWRRLVDAGRLRGRDAVAPARVALLDVVTAVAEAAERHGDPGLVAAWYALGPALLVDDLMDVEELRDDPAVTRLREIVERCGAASAELPDGYRPTDEQLDLLGDERQTWWYGILTTTGR